MKTIAVLGLLFAVGCTSCDGMPSMQPQAAGELVAGGDWSIAFEKDVICFGTMRLAQTGHTLSGIWDCGPNTGVVDGSINGADVTLVFSGKLASIDATATAIGTVTDNTVIHGTIDYPFQPGRDFAARRPWSF